MAANTINELGENIKKIIEKKLAIEFHKYDINSYQANQVSLGLLSMVIELPLQNLFSNLHHN
jgi:hypothetical protein